MKKYFLFLLLLIPGFLFPQNNFIKQITFGDFDARNVSHPRIPYLSDFYFQIDQNNASNIVMTRYNPSTDDFSDTTMITSDNFKNIFPIGGEGIVAFQTNRNGNWDIAYKQYVNGNWGNLEYIANSPEDEINPKKAFIQEFGFGREFFLLFQKADTIFFAGFDGDSLFVDPVFYNDSLYSYSDYSGVNYYSFGGLYPRAGYHVIAVQTDALGIKRLVSRYRQVNGNWQNINLIVDNCNCQNPTFQFTEWNIDLIFEDTLNTNTKLFKISDWEVSKAADTLQIPFSGNIYNYKSDMMHIVTKEGASNNLYEYIFIPHSYFVKTEDKTKIRVNLSEFGYMVYDTLINIKYPDSKSDIGNLGMTFGGEVFYTIWEDSSDGHIHLFGRKQIYPIDNVDNESFVSDFILYQNYPNPFNPLTYIEYRLLEASEIRFNVFNVLGEKVFEQNYGYQTAGDYKINFDGKNLPSGVYIYSIYTEKNRLSRKMMLMK